MKNIGDYIYGSSGDFGPAFFAAVDVKTGTSSSCSYSILAGRGARARVWARMKMKHIS